EGGAAVILESEELAVRRGAHVYAEIAGHASRSEALDMRKVDITGDSLASTLQTALKHSGLIEDDIDYINAHGSSVPDYDLCDVNAFKSVFGSRAYNIPITSIKSMLGQAISVSGVFQLIASCLSLEDSVIPPTINHTSPDPACDLDFVPNHARRCR